MQPVRRGELSRRGARARTRRPRSRKSRICAHSSTSTIAAGRAVRSGRQSCGLGGAPGNGGTSSIQPPRVEHVVRVQVVRLPERSRVGRDREQPTETLVPRDPRREHERSHAHTTSRRRAPSLCARPGRTSSDDTRATSGRRMSRALPRIASPATTPVSAASGEGATLVAASDAERENGEPRACRGSRGSGGRRARRGTDGAWRAARRPSADAGRAQPRPIAKTTTPSRRDDDLRDPDGQPGATERVDGSRKKP